MSVSGPRRTAPTTAAVEVPSATGGEGADWGAAARTATTPRQFPLLLADSGTTRRGGAQVIGLAVHLYCIEGQTEIRPALQVSGFARVHDTPLDMRALRDGGPAVHDDRLVDRRLEVIAGLVLVAGQRLIQGDVDPRAFRNSDGVGVTGVNSGAEAQRNRQQHRPRHHQITAFG